MYTVTDDPGRKVKKRKTKSRIGILLVLCNLVIMRFFPLNDTEETNQVSFRQMNMYVFSCRCHTRKSIESRQRGEKGG